eukprot:1284376-Pleurochrysis_carterae.AAC.1
MRERADGEEEWKLLRKRARPKVTILEKRTAAGLAQQEIRKAKLAAKRVKRAAKATERARIDAAAAACRALLRLEAHGCRGPAGPAQEAQAHGQDWLCALLAQQHGLSAAAADVAS